MHIYIEKDQRRRAKCALSFKETEPNPVNLLLFTQRLAEADENILCVVKMQARFFSKAHHRFSRSKRALH